MLIQLYFLGIMAVIEEKFRVIDSLFPVGEMITTGNFDTENDFSCIDFYLFTKHIQIDI